MVEKLNERPVLQLKIAKDLTYIRRHRIRKAKSVEKGNTDR